MRSGVITTFLLVSMVAAAAAQRVPAIPFESVPDPLKLPPGLNFGEVPGVAVNAQGHVFVFSRSNVFGGPAYGASSAQLFEFGPSGEFLREIGQGLYGWAFAHSVRIAPNGDIWTVDKGTDMIIRMNPQGRVVWVFGRRAEASDEGAHPWERVDPPLPPVDGRFRQPTDVALDSQGNIYISDGYVNSRVAKYDMNGDWVKSWGEPGTGPGQFRTPHQIVIDQDDNVYVGDRGNRRIQVFDTEGNFKRMFTIDVPPEPGTKAVNGATPTDLTDLRGVGAPNSMCIPPGQSRVMFVGESTWPGRIFKVTLQGEVLGVIGHSGRNWGEFSGAHGLACPSENDIWVAESSNWRIQRLLLSPGH
jgi:hypothetical protein